MDEQKIKEAAYALWEKDGKPHGHDLEHWFKASSALGEKGDLAIKGSSPKGNRTGQDGESIDAPVDKSMANSRKRKNAKI